MCRTSAIFFEAMAGLLCLHTQMPNGWRTIKSLVHKIRLHGEGKERLNPSREKYKGTHRRKKVDEKSCVTFLLCDPGWYVQRA